MLIQLNILQVSIIQREIHHSLANYKILFLTQNHQIPKIYLPTLTFFLVFHILLQNPSDFYLILPSYCFIIYLFNIQYQSTLPAFHMNKVMEVNSIQRNNLVQGTNFFEEKINKNQFLSAKKKWLVRNKQLKNKEEEGKEAKQHKFERDSKENGIKILVTSPKSTKSNSNATLLTKLYSIPQTQREILKISSEFAIQPPIIKKIHSRNSCTNLTYGQSSIKCQNQKNIEQPSQYYKYWKLKAIQYQQNNFALHKMNSQLQKEVEKLTLENKALKNKLQNSLASSHTYSGTPTKSVYNSEEKIQSHKQKEKTSQILEKRNKQLENQLAKHIQLIKKQEQRISMQITKIEELSKLVGQNIKLKRLMVKMEDKIAELKRNTPLKDETNGVISQCMGNYQEMENSIFLSNMGVEINHSEKVNKKTSYETTSTSTKNMNDSTEELWSKFGASFLVDKLL